MRSSYPYEQAVDKVRQRRSRRAQRLNVLQRVRFASSLAAALPAERRVLARRGWAGEKSGLSEQPAVASDNHGLIASQNVPADSVDSRFRSAACRRVSFLHS